MVVGQETTNVEIPINAALKVLGIVEEWSDYEGSVSAGSKAASGIKPDRVLSDGEGKVAAIMVMKTHWTCHIRDPGLFTSKIWQYLFCKKSSPSL